MNTAHRRGAALALLLCLAVSCVVAAVPKFTDQDVDNGYLNPKDTMVVQKVKIVDGSSTINSVWLRNLGSADERDIVRIVVDDDADPFTAPLAEYTTLTGLRTGLTLSLGYAVPNGTSYLWIGVEIAAAGKVAGGETIQLQLRFYSGAYTSDLVTDGSAEIIFKGAFEKVVDNALSVGYLNPGDANVRVQQATFTDDDGNNSGVGITKVSISNTGNADQTDITDVKVEIIVGATTYAANKPPTAADWGSANPLEFTAAEFPGMPAAFADDAEVVVRVRVTVGGTTDKHEIKTQIVLRAQENGTGYDQSILAGRTQTIRVQGLEVTRDVSPDIHSGVLGPEETMVQEVTVTDDDVNGANVTIHGIWIKNEGDVTKDDLLEIVVKRGAISLFTLPAAAIVDLGSGHRYIAADGFTPTVLTDDDSATLSIEYTIDGTITDGRTLQPRVYFWTNENAAFYESDRVKYPKSIVIHPDGLETVSNVIPPSGGTAYSGQRVLAQKVLCEDLDENTDGVRINPVRITNIAETDRCTPSEVAKIEVRTEGDKLLGQTTDVAGLNTGGVAISTLQNNVIADDGNATLRIYVTFAGPEDVTAGHTLKLETTVFAEEDGHAGEDTVRGAEWTLAINHRPVPNFTFAVAAAPAAIGPKAGLTYKDTIQFSGTATDPDGDAISSWRWNFGDGDTSDKQNPTHKYPDGGTFTVTLTVTDVRGLTGSVSKTIEVEGPPNEPPTIDELTADPENPAVDEDVQFGATVTDPDQPAGTAFGYEWDFGDETTSADAAPTHSYAEAETYTVTLTVTDSQGATDTATIEITVGNEPPVLTGVTAAPATGIGTGDEVTFTATGYSDPDDDEADHYEWNFGDGTTLNPGEQVVAHVFTAPGTYTVSVVAVDARDAKSAAKTVIVTVTGPERTVLFAFPNPAETVATFTYFLTEGATDPILRIYNLVGELVAEEELPAGATTLDWNLRTAGGTVLPNGLYFCVVTATGADPSEIFRLLIVR